MTEDARTELRGRSGGHIVRGEILDQISSDEARCFSLERMPDGSFKFWEECDGYFDYPLTAQQLLQLSDELRAAAEHSVRDPS